MARGCLWPSPLVALFPGGDLPQLQLALHLPPVPCPGRCPEEQPRGPFSLGRLWPSPVGPGSGYGPVPAPPNGPLEGARRGGAPLSPARSQLPCAEHSSTEVVPAWGSTRALALQPRASRSVIISPPNGEIPTKDQSCFALLRSHSFQRPILSLGRLAGKPSCSKDFFFRGSGSASPIGDAAVAPREFFPWPSRPGGAGAPAGRVHHAGLEQMKAPAQPRCEG